MTVQQAVELVDRLKPNKYTVEDKVRWLSDVDATIVRELFESHEDNPVEGEFPGYRVDQDDGTALLAPPPYDILYRWYLESQIDLANMEIGKYNNSRSLFNSAYLNFTDYWNRHHMPLQKHAFRFTSGRRRGPVPVDPLGRD